MELLTLVFALTLGISGRSSSNVTLASSGDFVVATWSASLSSGDSDIYAAVSRDGGHSFAVPVRVNSAAGTARVNGEQPPRAALSTRGSGQPPLITVVWTAKGKAGTELVTSQSTDGGNAFTVSRLVPGTDSAGNRGWESIAAGANGAVTVLWLDHRRLAERDAQVAAMHHEHGAPSGSETGTTMDGVAMAQLSQLYVATNAGPSADGRQVSARPITGGVCYCCKTAVAVRPTGGGDIYAAWRHVYAGNLRDIAFTMSRDGGRTFAPPLRVSEDKWQLEGCPDDGPAMAVETNGRVHIAWPTLVANQGKQTIGLFYARSEDGRAFTPRVPLPTDGLAHHPQIAATAAGLLTAWDELQDGKRRVVVAHAPASGASARGAAAPRFSRQVIVGSEGGVYPAIAATSSGGAVLAWTAGAGDGSTIRVMSLDGQ
jgi:hypothetical protein